MISTSFIEIVLLELETKIVISPLIVVDSNTSLLATERLPLQK